VPLRLHFGHALLDAGLPEDASEQFRAALELDPTNEAALMAAQLAAERIGDEARAAGYRTVLAGLQKDPDAEPEAPPGEQRGTLPAPTDTPTADAAGRAADRPRNTKVKRLRLVDPQSEDVEETYKVERPTLTLADVGGMESVKQRLNLAFLTPLRNPELREKFGMNLRGGLLMFGPPGCGKTFIARALAGEIGAQFVSIGLNDVLDMWLGEAERKLHQYFETARRNAPCVLFFDEVDAIGQKRSQLRHHAGRNVVNQLLAELDGAQTANDGVFVLGATNHPWDVDTALVRPGRFDRFALVLPPDAPARQAILKHHLTGRPVGEIDLGAVADATEDYSGADLAHICESAAELAMGASITSGVVRSIDSSDMATALREIRPSTRTWFETARNHALFSNDAGIYDELAAYMRGRRML